MRQIKTVLLLMGLILFAGAAKAETIRLVALGDSLSAGYELAPGESFPAQLEAALKASGRDVAVANAGVSGDTASGGLSRLDWAVPEGTQGVILELGANDALRGVDPSITERALDQILAALAERDIPVLLAGMIAPPNMGPDYAEAFNPIYARLAAKHDAILYPFFLEDIAADDALNLPDGMHPNAEGVAMIVKNIMPKVEALLARISK
ncbi:acyl-CoA thioesterase-1 [Rhodoligotrophos appendicifer]|uniref:arylesterase n=1 Tax=Rhodoligotrophos appendicifer TaxID=987056 RepID=UPI00118504F5|nr:arylesterase [Rhodoligotrophos appendicifer]